MRTFDELEAIWSDIPPAPRQRGTVELIVVRPGEGQRQTPDHAELSPESGLHGDRWSQAETPMLQAQISLMNIKIAQIIATDGDHGLFGDNFLVDLDLGVENLPVGTRLRLGAALIEITAKSHNGCKKYRERFGIDALRWINHEDNKPQRLRGVFARVIEAGAVRVGDAIEVLEVGDPRARVGDATKSDEQP